MKTMQKRISAAVAALSLCAGMTSAAMPVSAYLRGDPLQDGVVSVEDAQFALNAYADLVAGKYNTVYPEEAERADVNGDGALTAADAQLILLYYTANSVAQQPTSWHDLMPGAKKAGITDDGDILTIACWTGDDVDVMIEQFTAMHPEYKDKVKLVRVGDTAFEASQRLARQIDTGADIDLYVMSEDLIRQYKDDPIYSAPLSALGFTEQDFESCYPYTLSVGKDRSGVLKGVAWQVSPGGYVYRSDMAEKYLGVKTPAEMQKYVCDLDTFTQTAKTLKEKSGVAMVATYADLWQAIRMGSVAVTRSEDNHVKLSDDFKATADLIKMYYDNGYTTRADQWSDEWYEVGQNGTAFGYFFSSWCLGNGSMLYNAEGWDDGVTYGRYNITEGPCPWFWGGNWMLLSPYCDNKTIAHDFIYDFVVNPETMKAYSENCVKAHGSPEFVNNQKVMSSMDIPNPLLGGQSEFAVLHNNLKSLEYGSLHKDHDPCLEWDLESDLLAFYLKDNLSYAESVVHAKEWVQAEYPEYTFD